MIDFEFLLAAGIKTNRLMFFYVVPLYARKRLKFILERSLGRWSYPFSPYRWGGIFFFRLIFVLGFFRRLAGRPHFYTFSPYRRNGGGRSKYGIIV